MNQFDGEETHVSREYLVEQYRELVNEANEIIKDFDRADKKPILMHHFGGVLTDKDIVNKKGYIRSNVSKMSMEKLEMMITLLETFQYAEQMLNNDYKDIKELSQRLGVNPNETSKVLALLDYAKSKIADGSLSSYQIRDIIRARVQEGQTITQIKKAFDESVKQSMQNPDYWFTLFSESGRYI